MTKLKSFYNKTLQKIIKEVTRYLRIILVCDKCAVTQESLLHWIPTNAALIATKLSVHFPQNFKVHGLSCKILFLLTDCTDTARR